MTPENHKVYVHIFPNGKMYCGQTKRPVEVRKRYYRPHTRIASAISHYGWDQINTVVLRENMSKDDADYFERRIIAEFNLQDPRFGYNMANGGDGGATRIITPEIRDEMSERAKKFWDAHPEAKTRTSQKMIEYLKDPVAYKQRIESLSKTRSKIRKPVVCLAPDGTLIGCWQSARSAEEYFSTPQIHHRGISATCRGRQKTHGGYIWRFNKEEVANG